jgi:adenylate cyclase
MNNFLKPLGAVLIAAIIHVLIHVTGAVPFLDFRLYDVMSKTEEIGLAPESSSTVVVEIDEQSLIDLGQWPWPRFILAQVVEEIVAHRPAAVGLDILFPEPDRTSPNQLKSFYRDRLGLNISISGLPPVLADHDLIFAQALNSGPTVLPLFISSKNNKHSPCPLPAGSVLPIPPQLNLPVSQSILCNTPVLQREASGVGYINASIDLDGVFRRQTLMIGYQDGAVPSFGLALLAQIDPNLSIKAPQSSWQPITVSVAGHEIRCNSHAEILSRFFGRNSFKTISAAEVLKGNYPENLFTGKIVLIGATAVGLFDQFITSDGEILPGVFTYASLLENIFHDRCLYQPEVSKTMAMASSLLFSIVIIWLIFRRRYLVSSICYLAITIASILLTLMAIKHGVYPSLGYFLIPFSLFYFITSAFFTILHYIDHKHFLEDLGRAHSATIDSMTMVAETRDTETGAHIVCTKKYVQLLAQTLFDNGHFHAELNPHVIDLLYHAAPLHDIGKVGIPDAILRKPGKLTEAEFVVMKTHPQIGYTIIQNAINSYTKTNDFLTIAANIAYGHHEKWNGQGYPQGLKGQETPLPARLMALADVYDALISKRCYKDSFSFKKAEKIILAGSGEHFDPVIVEAFRKLCPQFRQIAEEYSTGGIVTCPHQDHI